MPYLGNVPAEAYTNTVKDSFNGDASTTAFTLSQPSTTNNLRVVVENVIQDPTVAYTVSGTTLTFTSAPPVGTANIYAVHLGPATQTAVPPSEINNATTYTSDLTVQGAFTSQGIDDNANATAITIDSSENVIVGKTSTAIENAGASLLSTGRLIATAENDDVVVLRRNSSDGDLISLRKDGSTVGSVGATAGVLTVGNATTGGVIFGYNAGHTYIEPSNTSGASTDDLATLGSGSKRFRDLYLSGGVYVGGTGSANYLQDYEEGNASSVTISGSSSGSASVSATVYYVKIGNIVNVSVQITNQTFPTFSGDLRCSLPFTCKTGTVARGGDCYWYPPASWDTQANFVGVIPQTVGTLAYAIFPDIKVDSDRQTNIGSGNSSLSGASGVYLNFSLTYQTA